MSLKSVQRPPVWLSLCGAHQRKKPKVVHSSPHLVGLTPSALRWGRGRGRRGAAAAEEGGSPGGLCSWAGSWWWPPAWCRPSSPCCMAWSTASRYPSAGSSPWLCLSSRASSSSSRSRWAGGGPTHVLMDDSWGFVQFRNIQFHKTFHYAENRAVFQRIVSLTVHSYIGLRGCVQVRKRSLQATNGSYPRQGKATLFI